MVRLIPYGLIPFLFQPVLHDWYNKGPKRSKPATILNRIKTNRVFKKMLFNKTRGYSIQISNKNQAAIANKISHLLICFCNFDLSYPILEKIYFYKTFVYCIVLLNSVHF